MPLSYRQRVERAAQLPEMTAQALKELSAGGRPVPLDVLAVHLGLCRSTVANLLHRLAHRRPSRAHRRPGGWVWTD